MPPVACGHCRRSFRGPAGLDHHLLKSELCRVADQADFDARADRSIESESESESDTEQSEDDAKREKNARMQEDIEQDVNMVEPDAGPQLGSSVLINKPPVDGDSPRSSQASVEDVPDEDDPLPEATDPSKTGRYAERYPPGTAGRKLEYVRTRWEDQREDERVNGKGRWGQFVDQDVFDMTSWLVDNAGKTNTDGFLKLPWVRKHQASLPFKNAEQLLKALDSLPIPGSTWRCNVRELRGDKLDRNKNPVVEVVEFWYRDINKCVEDLIGNPAFNGDVCYEPTKVYRDLQGLVRTLDEAWTGDWMWDVQKRINIGGTVAGVQIATDKTHLTNFSGNKQAYPVYVTINNISKAIRRKPNSRAQILLGYLPIPKLHGFKSKNSKKIAGHNLFHDCMSVIVKPLVAAGKDGRYMTCADGWIRRVFPILACYIGDAPEQSLVTCTRSNRCPKCLVKKDERGARLPNELKVNFRKPKRTKKIFKANVELRRKTRAFKAEGLQAVDHPFWMALPHCDIFMAITPDVLHQLHQGVIGAHLIPWLVEIADCNLPDESDARFQTMSQHPGLRHFKEGFSKLSQRSGNENREIEKIMLGLFAGAVPAAAHRAARALLDFCYYARWEQHDTNSLDAMHTALDTFHANRHIFIELGVRQDFNFQKIHSLEHYVESIYQFGATDGYSTETSERLHIDFAKRAYLFTNRRDFTAQMTTWLVRREKLAHFKLYQAWLDRLASGRPTLTQDSAEHAANVGKDRARENGGRIVGLYATYKAAKKPSVHNVSVPAIIDNYHAPGFVTALTSYLHSHGGSSSPRQVSVFDHFNLFTQFVIFIPGNPQTGPVIQRDRVRAVCESPGPTARTINDEYFSCVLVRVNTPNPNTLSTPLESLQPARVRLIFELPMFLRHSAEIPTRLAFVEWFTPLSKPHPLHGFRTTGPSWRSIERRERRVSIISIEEITRAIHLQPFFGTELDTSWRSESVMDTCTKFLLNPYITPRTWSVLGGS